MFADDFLDPGDKRGDDTSDFTLGGRFYYHLHSTAMSDFSLGGSVGVYSDQSRNGAGDTNRDTYIFVEPSLQIRCFLAANVALSFSAGLTLGLQDEDGFAVGGGKIDGNNGAIGGLVTGAAGIHYYFF